MVKSTGNPRSMSTMRTLIAWKKTDGPMVQKPNFFSIPYVGKAGLLQSNK